MTECCCCCKRHGDLVMWSAIGSPALNRMVIHTSAYPGCFRESCGYLRKLYHELAIEETGRFSRYEGDDECPAGKLHQLGE